MLFRAGLVVAKHQVVHSLRRRLFFLVIRTAHLVQTPLRITNSICPSFFLCLFFLLLLFCFFFFFCFFVFFEGALKTGFKQRHLCNGRRDRRANPCPPHL